MHLLSIITTCAAGPRCWLCSFCFDCIEQCYKADQSLTGLEHRQKIYDHVKPEFEYSEGVKHAIDWWLKWHTLQKLLIVVKGMQPLDWQNDLELV